MSITAFREMMEGKGCRIILGIISFALIIGMLNMGQCAGSNFGTPHMPGDVEIGKLGNKPIYLSSYLNTRGLAQEQMTKQRASQGDLSTPDPDTLAQYVYLPAVGASVDKAVIITLAEKEGINLRDGSMVDATVKSQEEAVMSQLKMFGFVKDGDSEEAIDNAFKSVVGATRADFVKSYKQKLETELKQPNTETDALTQIANTVLLSRYSSSLNPTDADLKEYVRTYVMKRIWLDPKKNNGADLKAKLQSIKADIEAKKISFEDAMVKYGQDAPDPTGKKKASELTHEYGVFSMLTNENYAPLKSLKVGDISEPLQIGDGYSIYKLIRYDDSQSKDFDKNKANMLSTYKQEMSTNKLMTEMKKIRAENPVTWNYPGFKVAYEFSELITKPMGDLNERVSTVSSLLDEALAASNGENAESNEVAKFMAYHFVKYLETSGAPGIAQQIAEKKIMAIEAVADLNNSLSVYLPLIDHYGEQKNGDKVVEYLNLAVGTLSGDFSQMGLTNAAMVDAKVRQWEKAGLVNADAVKSMNEQILAYRKSVKEHLEFLEKEEKAKQEAQKKAEEEQKKAEAEAKAAQEKAKAEEKKASESKSETKTGN